MYREMILKELEGISVTDQEDVMKWIHTLKEMGLLAKDIRVEPKNRYVEFAGVLIDKKEILDGIINNVIIHASIPTKEEELLQMKQTIKVGTEFTFRKEGYAFSLDDLGDDNRQDKNRIKQIEDADCVIKTWGKLIKNLKGKNVKGIKVCDVSVEEHPLKKHISKHYSAMKLQLTLQPLTYEREGCQQENWWINFDLDPMCIEIQAEPKTYEFYETYKNFINEIIFEICKNFKCEPDKNPNTGGGGHISLDYASAFLDNPHYFKNFLVFYASHVVRSDSNKAPDILTMSQDQDNAPFMHEIKELKQFTEQIRKFNCLPQEEATTEELVEGINRYVYTKMTTTLVNMGVKSGDAKHYQAVNLEHVCSGNLSDRRIEMRRFDAQESVDELLEELGALYELIQEARTCCKWNIDYKTYEAVKE